MVSTKFQDWREANPYIEDYFLYSEEKDCDWRRIKAHWFEKRDDGKDISHLCAFLIDLQTGDIYLDCSKRKIWAKCVALSLSRPYLGLVKTAYHLFVPLSIPVEIFKALIEGVKEQQTPVEIGARAWCNIKYSLVDIVRTPFYTVALLIVTLAGVIIGPFAPRTLYDVRVIAGRLESALNRGQTNFWTAAPCFQPLDNIMDIHKKDYKKADTEYENEPALQGLNNLARSYVKFRRENRNLFDNCGTLQSKEDPYISENQ